jgi:hypothetical protein
VTWADLADRQQIQDLLALVVQWQSKGKAGLDEFQPASAELLEKLYGQDTPQGGDRTAEVRQFVAEAGGEVG